ncbi:hypothetical protein [Bacillus pretiosus]|uniref:hypothetical protein n=1 Tax=Bacillus pretiosus TaxID=2983392 RepID=UPI003D64E98F
MCSPKTKSVLYKVWEKYNSPEVLRHPDEILKFLEEIIVATNGNLNLDYYSGGYADNFQSVKKVGDYFYLYWKNFEQYIQDDKITDELKAVELGFHDYNVFIYQALNIKSLSFIENNYDIYIVINCYYFPIRELYKEIINNYKITKKDIIEINTPNYIEFLFKDLNGYNHSCQLIPFPINSLLIQEKINPIDESISQEIMHMVTLHEFRKLLLDWEIELKSLSDYQDERKIKRLGNEIRSETERILKYYIIKNFHYGNENYEKLKPLYEELLKKYGHKLLGYLTNELASVEFRLPSDFNTILNTLSHDSGKAPLKKDIKLALTNFNNILNNYF